MLYGTVKPMCSNGFAGSFTGDAHSAGNAETGDVGESTKSYGSVARNVATLITSICENPRNTSTPPAPAPARAHVTMYGNTLANRSGEYVTRSDHRRVRQNKSKPSSISLVTNGANGSTIAPAPASRRAISVTASWISGSTANPTPASR